MKPNFIAVFAVLLSFLSTNAFAKKAAKANETMPAAPSVECDGRDENKGQNYVLNIAYQYNYHCKNGKAERFKFNFSYDEKLNSQMKESSIDLGEYLVRTIADEKALVYKIVYLKKKTFGDEVVFYIQVPNRTSSVAKVVFCKNNPSLRNIEGECGDEPYRVDSKDLFFKSKVGRLPSSAKDEAEELKHLMKTVMDVKSIQQSYSLASSN